MAAPEQGTNRLTQTPAEIRDDILTDVRLELVSQGVTSLDDAELSVAPGTDIFIWATAHANASAVTRASNAVQQANTSPVTADAATIDRWAEVMKLPVQSGSPAAGKIRLQVTGTGTMPDGREFVLPNGLRAKVVGTWPGVQDGDEVDAIAIDVGDATNFDGGEPVRFANPPTGINPIAFVSYWEPFTGGFDVETPARKRVRVLNRFANSLGGASWGRLREIAFDALLSTQDCFIYPALGGPASVKIVPVRAYDRARKQFTRVMPSAALQVIRAAIWKEAPDGDQYVVQAAADQEINVAITAELPDSRIIGGNGSGWLDASPWPRLGSGQTTVQVGTVTSSTTFTVSSTHAMQPIAGVTQIAWWSPVDKTFSTRLVTASGGSSGAWSVTVDRPFVNSDGTPIASGDYICPAAENLTAYGETWVSLLESLGCGENMTSYITNRTKRHPYVSDGPKSGLTSTELSAMQREHPEISDIDWSYRSATTPTVPGSINLPPNVFVPGKFAVYPS